ncbi:stress response protein NST1-like [Cotesia glomerata]|uniref:stress response protein NST1-like n=1 Tax=Cotesia glomerata TaxID=32391 RepID=UPI001D019E05|nr:stress response protein NST1-like [Cotesia glomerata]
MELNEDQLARMRVPELKMELRQRHLRTIGRKRELLERLRAALLVERERVQDEEEDEADSNDDDDDEEDDEIEDKDEIVPPRNDHQNQPQVPEHDDKAGSRGTPVIHRPRGSQQRVLLTFKDVEDTLKKFSGDDHTDVRRWLQKFEEMAELCEWNDVQKVAYSKRLLEGSAELFVEYENCSRTWMKLKKVLMEEFEKTVDSLQVHRELVKRKKKSDETLPTYAYKMLQIASQVNLEVSVVIKYIIEGIPDEAVNKSILYGAQTIKELKERFSQYESMKQEAAKTKTRASERSEKSGKADDRNKKKNSEVKSTAVSEKRCYNCGSDKHVSSACPDSQKGRKCFRCNGFGHIAAECPENNKPKDVYVVSRPKKEKYQKIVSINDYKTLALVDTGCDLTLICKSEYERLGAPTLRET